MMTNKRVIRIKDLMRKESSSYMEEFNGYHMLAYVSAQAFYNIGIEASVVTPNIIFSLVGVSRNNVKVKIREALADLLNWGLLEAEGYQEGDKIGNNDMLLITVPHMGDDRFTSLNSEFCMRILKAEETRVDTKINLLLVYAALAQYTGGRDYCFPSMETMAEELNLTRKTVAATLEILEELEIISYGSNGIRTASNGTFLKSNNVYVLNDIPNAREILQRELENMKFN